MSSNWHVLAEIFVKNIAWGQFCCFLLISFVLLPTTLPKLQKATTTTNTFTTNTLLSTLKLGFLSGATVMPCSNIMQLVEEKFSFSFLGFQSEDIQRHVLKSQSHHLYSHGLARLLCCPPVPGCNCAEHTVSVTPDPWRAAGWLAVTNTLEFSVSVPLSELCQSSATWQLVCSAPTCYV